MTCGSGRLGRDCLLSFPCVSCIGYTGDFCGRYKVKSMAIKTIDIADAGVVESIRSNMAVVTDSAKGLFPSNDYNVGPRRYNLPPKNLIEIGDTTGIWNRNFFWCIATLFRYAMEVFFCSTRNSETSTYGYAVKRVIADENDFLKIYKKITF